MLSVEINAYLSGLGFEPVKRRGADLWYLSPLRKESQASFKVNTHLNTWFDFGIGRGGNILSLAAEIRYFPSFTVDRHEYTDFGSVRSYTEKEYLIHRVGV